MIGKMKWLVVSMCLLTTLASCSAPKAKEAERIFRSDTLVNIPVNPDTTEPSERIPQATTPVAEAPQAEETIPGFGGSDTASAGNAQKQTPAEQKNTAKVTQSVSAPTAPPQPVATEPPVTEPPETLPPETEPPQTESPEAAVYEIGDYVPGNAENSVAELINTYRVNEGLPPLTMDSRLCGIASVRAYEASVSWSHTRPNGSQWQTVLTDYGYGFSVAAEELAYTSGYDASSAVSRWMNSDNNSADLLSEAYTVIGVGFYDLQGTIFLAVILT